MDSNWHFREYIQVTGVVTHAGVGDASGHKDQYKVEQFVTEAEITFRLQENSVPEPLAH